MGLAQVEDVTPDMCTQGIRVEVLEPSVAEEPWVASWPYTFVDCLMT